tara:strand:- start:220 stop:642 length:423 start_codon:yes stop_codon:yes gene_type:complete
MCPELPHELVRVIFDLAAKDDVATAKVLREIDHEAALRFARQVWFLGATTHYDNYRYRLPVYPLRPRRVARRLFFIHSDLDLLLRAAKIEAQAIEATPLDKKLLKPVPHSKKLFKALQKCVSLTTRLARQHNVTYVNSLF